MKLLTILTAALLQASPQAFAETNRQADILACEVIKKLGPTLDSENITLGTMYVDALQPSGRNFVKDGEETYQLSMGSSKMSAIDISNSTVGLFKNGTLLTSVDVKPLLELMRSEDYQYESSTSEYARVGSAEERHSVRIYCYGRSERQVLLQNLNQLDHLMRSKGEAKKNSADPK